MVSTSVPDVLRKMMSSAVTTVEATDWSISLRMDTPTLQAKEPLVQAVLASCTANLQWTPPETAVTDRDTIIVRCMPIFKNTPIIIEQSTTALTMH